MKTNKTFTIVKKFFEGFMIGSGVVFWASFITESIVAWKAK